MIPKLRAALSDPPWRSALVRRELGLHGDRPLWRTRIGRMLLFIALVLTLDSIHFAWRASLWDAIILTDINSAVVAARRVETRELILFTWLCAWLSLAAFLTPLWMCARAWGRLDRDPGWDQIRLTGVRPAELIWGKTVSWFGVWLTMIVVALVIGEVFGIPRSESGNSSSLLGLVRFYPQWPAEIVRQNLMPTTLIWCQFRAELGMGAMLEHQAIIAVLGAGLFAWVSVLSLRWGAGIGFAATAIAGGVPFIAHFALGPPFSRQVWRAMNGEELGDSLCLILAVSGAAIASPLLLRAARQLCGSR